MSVPCSEQFIRALLTDIGVSSKQIDLIVCRLKFSVTTFNNDKPQNTLSDIVNDLFECLRPNANDVAKITASEISNAIIFTIIFTAIFIILIVILLITMNNTLHYFWTIIFAILFALFYIGIVFLFLYNARVNISNTVIVTETKLLTCLNTAVTSLAVFEADTQTAVSNALCAYAKSNC